MNNEFIDENRADGKPNGIASREDETEINSSNFERLDRVVNRVLANLKSKEGENDISA